MLQRPTQRICPSPPVFIVIKKPPRYGAGITSPASLPAEFVRSALATPTRFLTEVVYTFERGAGTYWRQSNRSKNAAFWAWLQLSLPRATVELNFKLGLIVRQSRISPCLEFCNMCSAWSWLAFRSNLSNRTQEPVQAVFSEDSPKESSAFSLRFRLYLQRTSFPRYEPNPRNATFPYKHIFYRFVV